jgi:hypothetical protein
MRVSARWGVALLLAAAGCSSEENTVLSGFPGIIISPVRSSISAQMSFKDNTGGTHQQWVVAMTDQPDLCTKIAQHPDYFQNPIEPFDAVIVWVPPGNLGTYIEGQKDTTTGSVAGCEVIGGAPAADGGTAQTLKLGQFLGLGGTISLSQFNVGAGGEAKGSFDIAVTDPAGNPREYVGTYKATYCTGMENAQLP